MTLDTNNSDGRSDFGLAHYFGGIERGERNVALQNIEAIAKALGLTLATLMEDL